MIKNLIFDFGKVLVDYDFEAFFTANISDEQRRMDFVDIIYRDDIQREMDLALTPLSEFFDRLIAKHPDFNAEIRFFDEHFHEIVTNEMPGMRELLLRFKSQGYSLYGLSNWCTKVYHTMEQFPIFGLLDGRVISSEEHVVKPDPEIYNILFSRYDLKPEECVFADDRAENIAMAERLGMRSVLFTTAHDYEKQLIFIVEDYK